MSTRDEVMDALERVEASIGSAQPMWDSSVPFGAQAHRALGKAVSRQTNALRDEMRAVVGGIRIALLPLVEAVSALNARIDDRAASVDDRLRRVERMLDPGGELPDGRPSLLRRLEDLLDRLLALEAALGAGPESVAVLLERVDRLEQEVARLSGAPAAGAAG